MSSLSSETILFNLKRMLLEYLLRHRVDSLVFSFAWEQKSSFSLFEISSIRFELFNMYILIKHHRIDRFESIISFLNEFNLKFKNIIPEQLFNRVQTSVKALKIFDCLRKGDCKMTVTLIKDYFPDQIIKTELETKIIKLRAQWNELILDSKKREIYFQSQFSLQFDDKFMKFLLQKSIDIINLINNLLPMTKFDELMANNFKNASAIFFKENQDVEFEDGVRLDLILDNLKLYHIQLQTPNQENKNQNPKKKTYLSEQITNTKYLRRILKVLIQWESSLTNKTMNRSDFFIMSQVATEPETQSKPILHDLLYLDSQFDSFRLNEPKDEDESLNFNNQSKTTTIQFQNGVISSSKQQIVAYNLTALITDDENDPSISF